MKDLAIPLAPDRWLAQLFSASIATGGGIVRLHMREVERLVGRDRFLREIRRRGFKVIENAGHFLVICNSEPVRMLY